MLWHTTVLSTFGHAVHTAYAAYPAYMSIAAKHTARDTLGSELVPHQNGVPWLPEMLFMRNYSYLKRKKN